MTRYPDAEWVPGPPNKQGGYPGYSNQNAVAGIVLHGMDGYYATGGLNMLQNSGQSWHFSILFDGSVKQHYELEAQCYQSGIASMNRRTIGIEHEGTHSIPPFHALTEAQIVASVKLCKWIAALPVAYDLVRGQTLWLHKDLGTSQCPSTRFDSVLHRWLASPAPPQYEYPVPGIPLDEFRYKGTEGQPWIHKWDLNIYTHQPDPDIKWEHGAWKDGKITFSLTVLDWEENK